MWGFSEVSGGNSFLIFRKCRWFQHTRVNKERNVLRRVKKESNCINNNNIYLLQLGCYPVAVVILHVYKTWNWLNETWNWSDLAWELRTKNVIEWKIGGRTWGKRKRGRRRKQLLDELKEKRLYCKLKKKALDRTVWRPRYGRVCGRLWNEYKFLGSVLQICLISVCEVMMLHYVHTLCSHIIHLSTSCHAPTGNRTSNSRPYVQHPSQ